MSLLKRLGGALLVLSLAETVIPGLVACGRTQSREANVILGQIPALRDDINREVERATAAMETIQDRVEVIAQFLLLHRAGLTRDQSAQLDTLLNEVRGIADGA